MNKNKTIILLIILLLIIIIVGFLFFKTTKTQTENTKPFTPFPSPMRIIQHPIQGGPGGGSIKNP